MEADEKPLTEEEMHSAFKLLRKLTPELELLPLGRATVYTTLVTLWMLTLQRLGGGFSLAEAVKVVQNYGKNLLPDNKRVREGTLSKNSGAYSEAETPADSRRRSYLPARSAARSSNVPLRGSAINGRTSLMAPPSRSRPPVG